MCLAGEGIEPITQGPIEPLHMHRANWLNAASQRSADFHRQQSPMLIAMLDRLHQRHRLWNHPRRASALAGPLPLTIGSHQDVLIALPAITEPVQLTLVSPLDGGRHCSLDQVFAQRTSGTRHYETTVAVLDQAAPAFSLIRLTRCPLFFCTND